MTDLQCPVVLLLAEDPEPVLQGRALGAVGPAAEVVELPAEEGAAAEDALVEQLSDTRRGETVVLRGPAQRLSALLERHGCRTRLPARVEADSQGWRRADPEQAAEPAPERPELPLRVLRASEMTGLQMHGILHLRERVFVVEQGISSVEEIEASDAWDTTVHLWLEDDGRPVSVLRVLYDAPEISIGRVATDAEHRGKGLSGVLIRAALREIEQAQAGSDQPARPIQLHAQAHLEGWYARFGFVREGEVFQEAGIPHVSMVMRP